MELKFNKHSDFYIKAVVSVWEGHQDGYLQSTVAHF